MICTRNVGHSGPCNGIPREITALAYCYTAELSGCSECHAINDHGVSCSHNPERFRVIRRVKLSWEYRGEGLYIFWNNPFNGGIKEDVAMFMWPSHPPELTSEVEKTYEQLANRFCEMGG